MRRKTGLKLIQAACVFAALFSMLIITASCGGNNGPESPGAFESFRDIPGVLPEEIEEIERLLERNDYFVFGMGPGDEALILENEIGGFAAHFAEWLEGLFGVPFVPVGVERNGLAPGLRSGALDFTAQLPRTPETERAFFMTDTIAKRSMAIMRKEDAAPLARIMEQRPLRFTFYGDTNFAELVAATGVFGDFEAIPVECCANANQLLFDGEVDGFLCVRGLTMAIAYPYLVVETLEPFIFMELAFATANPELAVFVRVVQRAIENGGMAVLGEFFARGIEDFNRHRMDLLLTDSDRAFIEENPVVHIAAHGFGYPVSFFNAHEREFQGIGIDILRQVEEMTGMRFEIINEEPLRSGEVMQMLEDGEVSLTVGVLHQGALQIQCGGFMWSNPFFTDFYALLSPTDYPNVSINEVIYRSVGVIADSAYEQRFISMFPNHSNLKRYLHLDDLLEALDSGEIELAFSSLGGLQRMTNYFERVWFRANITFDESFEVSFATPQLEPLISILNKAMAIIDTEVIANAWMGRNFDYSLRLLEARWQARIPLFAIGITLLVCIIGLISALYNLARREKSHLKKLVAERTEALEMETAVLNALFDSIPDVLFSKDNDFKYSRVNKAFEVLFGKSRDELLGKTDGELLSHPEVAASWHEDDTRVLNERSYYRIEEPVPDADGTFRTYETIKVPLVFQGKSLGILGLSRDITLRKEMEESIINTSNAKSAFIANMSHEIRKPMNSIIGFSELALEERLSNKARTYLRRILESSNWLLQIINDVLDISKVEAGRFELDYMPFSLEDIFAKCRTVIMPSALDKNIPLIFSIEELDEHLVGDPLRLRQIFTNLLTNAIKFTDTGIVSVKSTIIKAEENSKTIRFEVRDTGIGMTREQIDKSAEPFMQADVSITRKYGGTGLGLPIVNKLLEMMGSALQVESEVGRGSVFSFELAFETIESPRRQRTQARQGKPLFSGEALVCEDNVMNRMVISDHLARVGLTAVIADNGLAGVELARTRFEKRGSSFDLIFMDIHMPVMGGLEAAKKIFELGNTAPIIALTANIMENDKELYKQCGMTDCIGKPFTSNELWTCLLKYLEPVNWLAHNSEEEMPNPDDGDFRLMQRLNESFVRDNKGLFAQIRGNIGDNVLVHRLVHTLKGSAGLIRKKRLHDLAAEMEVHYNKKLKGHDVIVPTEKWDALEKELDTVLSELSANIDRPMKEQKVPEPERLRELFERLEALIKSRSPESLELLDEIQAIPGAEELANQLETYDFRPALKTLEQLKEAWRLK